MVTIKEIAKRANVSLATVSRVVNLDDTMAVSPETRRLILEIAHQMGYVPPKRRKAKNQAPLTIGVADWKIIREEWGNYRISTLTSMAQTINPSLNVHFVRLCAQDIRKVDGIIALGSFTHEEIDRLHALSFHIVFVNADQDDYDHDQIVIDFKLGMRQMAEYLVKEKHFSAVGYLGGVYDGPEIRIGYHRLQQFEQCLRDCGAYRKELVRLGEMTADSGYRMMKEAIQDGSLPEAVLLGNDAVAEGALSAVEEAGLSIPEDLSVILYNDIETLKPNHPNYTTIKMYPDFVWQTAIELLFERILGRRSQTMKIIIPTRLLLGEST
ncbi:LacI family DNA-binding transcriptional regulator [Ethanoligenens harbinense]|uniref:LacI family DNA-binding transcriptional regulator n=1 Tax=Ethanoligenens harbinense TaxID=253239 RepID=UPI000EA152EF|nr:substrate-binding domain-containing protein [Ethanoligenens harbinense]AYF41783.1 LacI family transcriptional regulator [Ethanoligenens harbinense]